MNTSNKKTHKKRKQLYKKGGYNSKSNKSKIIVSKSPSKTTLSKSKSSSTQKIISIVRQH